MRYNHSDYLHNLIVDWAIDAPASDLNWISACENLCLKLQDDQLITFYTQLIHAAAANKASPHEGKDKDNAATNLVALQTAVQTQLNNRGIVA